MKEDNKPEKPIIGPNSFNGSEEPDFHEANVEEPEVHNELSQVADTPKKNLFILLAVIILVILGLYLSLSTIFTDKFKQSKSTVPIPKNVTKPGGQIDSEKITVPQLPETPQISIPSLPEIKVPTPSNPIIPTPTPENPAPVSDNTSPPALPTTQPVAESSVALPNTPANTAAAAANNEKQARLDAKRKSGIILVAGTPAPATPEQVEVQQNFKERGKLQYLLARGKIIYATIESAVSSDFTGEIRAIVSRDVYSENAKVLLIPRGSKVFGQASLLESVYGRIIVAWNRIDVAGTNYSINIQSPSVDALGREGIQGRIDEKYAEKMANSVMLSAFSVATASALDKLVKPPTLSNQSQELTDISNALLNNAITINSTAGLTSDAKIQSICGSSPNFITDKSSKTYTEVQRKCAEATSGVGNPDDRLKALITDIIIISNSVIKQNVTQSIITQPQQASRDAFSQLTQKLQSLIPDQELNRTITLDQGQSIRIYINKDYNFPKQAIVKSRILR